MTVDRLLEFLASLNASSLAELSATTATSYVLIVAAEMGDKSQLVCMSLATRHKAMPVILGACAAFALLNTLAVVFGVAIATWLPEYVIASIVAVLFTVFGIHALRVQAVDEDAAVQEKSSHGIFFSTLLLMTLAEFGDKTQLAVVALSSTAAPIAVWLGSTAALTTTSIIGVIAGRTILQKLPLTLLHKISGSLFLILATMTAYRVYLTYLP